MRIWIDACTGKHVRYAVAIARALRQVGHEIVLTTREHPDTIALAHLLGEKFVVVGRYDPTSLLTRIYESLNRQLSFLRMFRRDPPDLAICHQSVELCRVAYALGIPILSTADSPHADAVNRLTLPLIDVLVISEAIPKRCYMGYGVRKIVQYKGVDEVAWIKNSKTRVEEERKRPLIVVRQMETKASYMMKPGLKDVTEKVALDLASMGDVVFIPRYDRRPREGLIVPENYVDTLALSAKADVVVSVGGTIAREAALQGTPSIVMSTSNVKQYVNRFLSRLGFPLFVVKPGEVLSYTKRFIGKKWDVKDVFERLENPVDVILRVIKENFM